MSSFYTYSMTENNLTELSNQAKELLADALRKEGMITEEQCQDIKDFYAVVVARKGWLGRTWDKLRGATEDKGMQMHVVKDVLTRRDVT